MHYSEKHNVPPDKWNVKQSVYLDHRRAVMDAESVLIVIGRTELPQRVFVKTNVISMKCNFRA